MTTNGALATEWSRWRAKCFSWQKEFDFLGLASSFLTRYIVLIPMAFCIFLILDSQDRMVRLGAILVLIILEQIREWMLVNSVKSLSKGGK